MEPPWKVVRLTRKDIDGNPEATVERIRVALGCPVPRGRW
jgi:hypothetical protein